MKIKCYFCNKLFFKIVNNTAKGTIDIEAKCPRCGRFTVTKINFDE